MDGSDRLGALIPAVARGHVGARVLDLGYVPAGMYTSRPESVYWDGRSELGEDVASGVYFAELRAGTHRTLRRLLLAK